jgi:hypothetical protein
MLHKDYDRKGSVVKTKTNISGCDPSQGAWRKDKPIGSKSPVVK